jgi:type IV secretory pathway VirJ component
MAPFIANRLSSDLRPELALVALLGPAERASFQFHWTDLLTDTSKPSDPPILPELERLRGTPVLCVYGKDEKESLCRLADTSAVRVDKRPGRHHFDGAYDAIAGEIIRLLAPVNAAGR